MLAILSDNERYLAMAAQYERRIGPRDAEMVPGIEGKWLIVRAEGGREQTVAAHLAGRRFGIYLPQFPETLIVRGRKIDRLRNLFPGYVFVFVWGVQQHIRRILAVPGVIGMVMRGDVPAVLPFHVIEQIRAQEECDWPLVTTVDIVHVRKRRKKYSQYTETKLIHVAPEDIVSVRAAGWIKGLTDLSDEERNSALQSALGLNDGGSNAKV